MWRLCSLLRYVIALSLVLIAVAQNAVAQERPKLEVVPQIPHWEISSVIFSPDGHRVLSGGDNTLKLWDVGTGALLRTFEGDSNGGFSPDGLRVLSGSHDKTLKLWDASSGALLRTFEGHSNRVASVAFSPDGSRVLSGSVDKTLKLWDATSGTLLRTFEGHSSWVNS